MGWAEPNGNGWRPTWRANGKRDHGPTFSTKEAAVSWLAENAPGRALVSVAEAIETWRGNSKAAYADEAAQRVAEVCRKRQWSKLRDITPIEIARWHAADKRGYVRPHQYLMTILRWADRMHAGSARADTLAVSPPKYQRRAKPSLMPDETLMSIRETAWTYGRRAGAVIDYLASYGARSITACRLRVRDLDPIRCTLTIPNAKHSGGWVHPVTETQAAMWHEIAGHLGPDGPLFPHYIEDRPWRVEGSSATEIKHWYRGTIAKRLKLASPHNGLYQVKRWAITTMLSNGLDPATVALFTGHLDLDQVLTYNTTSAERARKALDGLKTIGGNARHLCHLEKRGKSS